MEYLKGRLFINSLGRYQIQGTSYYFTSGDYMELFDEDSLEWLIGRIEHHFDNGYYFLCSNKKIFNLDNHIAKVPTE